MKLLTIEENLFRRVKEGAGGCWLWTGRTNRSGYGEVISRERYAGMAHRLMYEFMIAEIPESLEIDHLCRVRNCVNPYHLEPVTPAVNKRRAADTKTTCSKGHVHSGVNSEGYRICRVCMRENQRRSRARKRVA